MDYNFQILLTDDFLIERPSSTADNYGGFTTSYSTIGTVKGRLDDESLSEILRARQDIGKISHRLFLYPDSDVMRDDRITGLNRVLRVKMIRTEFEDHPLEVLCEEMDP